MGHKLSTVGISADQTKIKAIQSLQSPKSITELRSFLGMVTYCIVQSLFQILHQFYSRLTINGLGHIFMVQRLIN